MSISNVNFLFYFNLEQVEKKSSVYCSRKVGFVPDITKWNPWGPFCSVDKLKFLIIFSAQRFHIGRDKTHSTDISQKHSRQLLLSWPQRGGKSETFSRYRWTLAPHCFVSTSHLPQESGIGKSLVSAWEMHVGGARKQNTWLLQGF